MGFSNEIRRKTKAKLSERRQNVQFMAVHESRGEILVMILLTLKIIIWRTLKRKNVLFFMAGHYDLTTQVSPQLNINRSHIEAEGDNKNEGHLIVIGRAIHLIVMGK